ncbi:MAG: hypothetical protein R2712_01675 [Vicinamibacterales bacterium]
MRLIDVPILVDEDELGLLTVGYRLDDERARELATPVPAQPSPSNPEVRCWSPLGPGSGDVLAALDVDAAPTTIRIGDEE